MRLEITLKMHISSFCPIVQTGEATRPYAPSAASPLTPAQWAL